MKTQWLAVALALGPLGASACAPRRTGSAPPAPSPPTKAADTTLTSAELPATERAASRAAAAAAAADVVGAASATSATSATSAASVTSVTSGPAEPAARADEQDRPSRCPDGDRDSITLESSDLDMLGTGQVERWALCLTTPRLEHDVVKIAGDPELADTVRDAILTRGIDASRVIVDERAADAERITIELVPR